MPVRSSPLFRPCMPRQTAVTQTTSHTLYSALSRFHGASDGASAALRSLTACAIQL